MAGQFRAANSAISASTRPSRTVRRDIGFLHRMTGAV
jgi:hypothetical protein